MESLPIWGLEVNRFRRFERLIDLTVAEVERDFRSLAMSTEQR